MKKFLAILLALLVGATIVVWARYGGGRPYPDITAMPRLDESLLFEEISYPEPIGNVAVSQEGRVFFTVHPESRPEGNRLLEWVANAAIPYPNGTVQPHLFDTVLGITVDRRNWLWSIDHGNHGMRTARLVALELATGNVVHDYRFRPEAAPAGSMLQDLRVTADGSTVFIADASVWGKRPAIVVYDVATRKARRVLESHFSVTAQDYFVQTPTRAMRFLGGLATFRAGVDGLALDANDEYLYFAAISHSGLFRVPVRDLIDATLPARDLESRVERHGDKPLSDGIIVSASGEILVTDIEHGAVHAVDAGGNLSTLIRSPRIRWADGLALGPDGRVYLADSALQDVVLRTSDHMRSQAPYFIFSFDPGLGTDTLQP